MLDSWILFIPVPVPVINSTGSLNRAQEIDKNYIEFKLNKSEYLFFENKIEDAINCLKEIIKESKIMLLILS